MQANGLGRCRWYAHLQLPWSSNVYRVVTARADTSASHIPAARGAAGRP